MIIGDEHRSLELLRSRNRKTPYITVKEHITARIVNLEAKCQRMLSDSQTSRTELVVSIARRDGILLLMPDDAVASRSHASVARVPNLYGDTSALDCLGFGKLSDRTGSKIGRNHIRDCRRSVLERDIHGVSSSRPVTHCR